MLQPRQATSHVIDCSKNTTCIYPNTMNTLLAFYLTIFVYILAHIFFIIVVIFKKLFTVAIHILRGPPMLWKPEPYAQTLEPNLGKVLPCRYPCHTWHLGLGKSNVYVWQISFDIELQIQNVTCRFQIKLSVNWHLHFLLRCHLNVTCLVIRAISICEVPTYMWFILHKSHYCQKSELCVSIDMHFNYFCESFGVSNWKKLAETLWQIHTVGNPCETTLH
jgi:hypothetical protein